MQPYMLAILLTCLAISSAYAQTGCPNNCASCSGDSCNNCNPGYGVYAGECFACPVPIVCATCNAHPIGDLQVVTTCVGLYTYWYAYFLWIFYALFACCCSYCSHKLTGTRPNITIRQSDDTSVKVQMSVSTATGKEATSSNHER